MLLLNLGCGTKTSDRQGVVNIDRTAYLRIKRNKLLAPFAPLVLRGDRIRKYRSLPDNIRVHDLSRGIPFPDGSVDAVYHCHLFEHLDREVAERFLREVLRVLKPGGVHRIVVPDLELGARQYLAHLDASTADTADANSHDDYVAGLIEQSVRKEAFGTGEQNRLSRCLENLLFGDARRRGETHQWMYDCVNLTVKLNAAGYSAVHIQNHTTSLIDDWPLFGLDTNQDGSVYKPGSLYIEAVK